MKRVAHGLVAAIGALVVLQALASKPHASRNSPGNPRHAQCRPAPIEVVVPGARPVLKNALPTPSSVAGGFTVVPSSSAQGARAAGHPESEEGSSPVPAELADDPVQLGAWLLGQSDEDFRRLAVEHVTALEDCARRVARHLSESGGPGNDPADQIASFFEVLNRRLDVAFTTARCESVSSTSAR